MSTPFGPYALTLDGITQQMRRTFETFIDPRKGKNKSYTMVDAALSAFSVFFTQSPSFLEYQRSLEQTQGNHNARTLFGVHNIPSDNHIRSLLDAIARDNLPYIRTLLTMQFDLDTVDDQGMTPLMRAAERGNFKVVQMFIKCGASPLLSGPSGRASDVALRHNFPAISEFLKKVEEVQLAEAARRAGTEGQTSSAVVS